LSLLKTALQFYTQFVIIGKKEHRTQALQFYAQFINTGKEEDRTQALQFYAQFIITGKEGERTQAPGSQFSHRNDARIRTKTIPLSPCR